MVFKIGILIILFLIIWEIDEVVQSIERLNRTIRILSYQEESKDENKDPIVSTFKKE